MICSFPDCNEKSSKAHEYWHMFGEFPFKCEVCGKTFPRQAELDIHMLSHGNVRPFECDLCELKFKLKFQLKSHLLVFHIEKRLECEMCGKVLRNKTKESLELHMSTHVKDRFKCEFCGKSSFEGKRDLDEHRRTHTGVKPHKCEVCLKSFNHHRNLAVHMRTHRTHAFRCGTCKKSFARKAQLEVHERKHTGEKPYACDMCGLKFRGTSMRADHKRNFH